MFTNGGHFSSTVGATGFDTRPMSRMDEMKKRSQKNIDEIATELIRGNFDIESYEISRNWFEPETTKLNVIIGHKRHEVEITIKG